MTLDSLTEQAAHAVIKQYAMHVAASMIHGSYPERDRAWSTAHELQEQVGGFVELVKRSITMLGAVPEDVWTVPVERLVEPMEPKQASTVRSALARHIAGAYISGSDAQVARAKELETDLDKAGLNVDDHVDRIVLMEMRRRPSDRGTHGRADNCPF